MKKEESQNKTENRLDSLKAMTHDFNTLDLWNATKTKLN